MTGPLRAYCRAALAALLAGGLTPGCVGSRPAPDSVAPPAGYPGAGLTARQGFQAVYEGELRIWFHSFRAIWCVDASPAAARLAVAVLSPTGVKIMQTHSDSAGRECGISLPAAARLRPYGEAMGDALWWSFAAGDGVSVARWMRHRNRTMGTAELGDFRALYVDEDADGTMDRIVLRRNGRRQCSIRLADFRADAGRAYPARIRIDCARPRCRLTLSLKNIGWTESPGESPRGDGP